jgi:D-inositol-3-phosphate glycosyltransferase
MIRAVAYLSMHTSPLAQPGTGYAGGMNVYVHELSETMADRDVNVVVFTRRTGLDQPKVVTRRPGYRVVHIAAGPPKDLRVDLLPEHVAEFAQGVVSAMSNADAAFDVIHSHYWLSGWSGVLVKEATGLPLINSFHTLGRIKDLTRRPGEPTSGPIRTLTEDEVLAKSDAVVASTPHEVQDLIAQYGADPSQLHVSPPGVDHLVFSPGDRVEARRWLGLGNEPIILYAGRIEPHKGVDVAVEALAKLPESVAAAPGLPQLVVVGGPSGRRGTHELDNLLRIANELGIGERTHFLPAQPHALLADFYRAADVLIMPSRSESFGLVAAEAQACGLPVVASDVGGLRYVIDDGRSGLMVDKLDASAFADALLSLLDDPGRSARFAHDAVANAEQFSWRSTAHRLLELYAAASQS